MMEKGYLTPPDEIDMVRVERAIRRAGLVAVVALIGAVPLAYLVLPALIVHPEGLADRLAFAARVSVVVLLCVVVGVGLVSTTRRFSPRDVGGSAAGPPSDRLAVYAAFLQNTLEQAVIAVGLYFALATLLTGDWLVLIVVGAAFFVLGRVLFLRGYERGAEGRALGMTLTMMPTLFGYLLAVGLMIGRLF